MGFDDKRWLSNIKRKGQLSIFPGQSIKGSWARVFPQAIDEFNKLSSQYKLGVTLTVGATPPSPKDLNGADVQVEALTKVSFPSHSGPVDIDFNSPTLAGAKGDTIPVPSLQAGGRTIQTFISMNPDQKVTPPGGVQRDAGDPILMIYLVHEFVHVCGLYGTDNFSGHTSLRDPDLFAAVLSPVVGADPADDKVDVGSGKKVPPPFLATETVNRIKALWLVPDDFHLHIHFPHTF